MTKKYGNKVLETAIHYLQYLHEHGLNVQYEGHTYVFKVHLSTLIADNLGVHSIGGILESFSVIRICRVCMGKKHDVGRKFHHEDFVLRTKIGYEHQLHILQGDPTLSTLYGLKRKCPFNNIAGFHVINCSAPDFAHDFLREFATELLVNSCQS